MVKNKYFEHFSKLCKFQFMIIGLWPYNNLYVAKFLKILWPIQNLIAYVLQVCIFVFFYYKFLIISV